MAKSTNQKKTKFTEVEGHAYPFRNTAKSTNQKNEGGNMYMYEHVLVGIIAYNSEKRRVNAHTCISGLLVFPQVAF